MSIEVKKERYYRAEDGSKQGPLDGADFKWVKGQYSLCDPLWNNDGTMAKYFHTPHGNLIAEWKEPARESRALTGDSHD